VIINTLKAQKETGVNFSVKINETKEMLSRNKVSGFKHSKYTMKTKPITLILTLLFCLSASVFAEEEKAKSGQAIMFRAQLAFTTAREIKRQSEIRLKNLKDIQLKIEKTQSDLS
jgi:hypothetical protein